MVKEEEINEVVLNSSYMLSTVKFNNDVIKIMLNEEYFTNKEEEYTLFEKTNDTTNFQEYIDEVEIEKENQKGDNMGLFDRVKNMFTQEVDESVENEKEETIVTKESIVQEKEETEEIMQTPKKEERSMPIFFDDNDFDILVNELVINNYQNNKFKR